jgi:hypothetical protein
MSKIKKKQQLGTNRRTASATLKKMIMFDLIKRLELNYCFQCGCEIKIVSELSIEHKIPWLDSEKPLELFFDLNNIAFSHLKCNIGAARKPSKIIELSDYRIKHAGKSAYTRGCRCNLCRNYKRKENSKRTKSGTIREVNLSAKQVE